MMNKYSRQPGDSILALLEPGEYVLNRNAVEEIGKENLDDLNYDDAPRFDMSQRGQFQAGGMLGDMIGMQAGGDTLSYGGATTETQSLDDIYKKMGMQPNSQQLSQFEKQYAYDPSREGVIFEDYGRAITGATQAGQQNLMGAGQKMQQSQAKAGFAGGGAGQQAQQQARSTIMQDFLAQEGAAKSSLFKDVREEREDWMTDVGAGLTRLQGQEGTEDYGGSGITPSVREDYNPSATGPPGWPTIGAYDSWVTSGSDPNTMVNFGYQAPAAGTSTTRAGTSGVTVCFVAGTMITMSDEGLKRIEDIDIDDIVKSWNEESGKIEDKKVTKLIRPLHDDIVKLKFGDIETSNTFDHPYYVKDKGWSSYKPEWTMDRYDIGDISQLEEGDICYKYEDGELHNIKLDNTEENLGRVQTYIFKVESNRTFFANNILVHNK
jgi:hypothetical protein